LKTLIKLILLFFLIGSNHIQADDSLLNNLLEKYVSGDIRYKKVISDTKINNPSETIRNILVEIGGYHSGSCRESGMCGCAEMVDLFSFTIPNSKIENTSWDQLTLSNDCTNDPRLVVKKKGGQVLIGTPKFITEYVYDKSSGALINATGE